MKKIIKRFWGVAFVLVLLSAMLVGAVPQASGMNYLWFNSMATPGSLPGDLTLAPAGTDILDVAQSGSTVVITTVENVTNTNHLYRSTDGGVTWAEVVPTAAPQGGNWTMVALAPDNPQIIAVVTNNSTTAGTEDENVPNTVWLSKNNGANFFQLGNLPVGAWINDIAISPKVGGITRVTVGGNLGNANSANITGNDNQAYLATWPLDAVAPVWTPPVGGWGLGGLAGTSDDVVAVAYSPNYLADYALMVVTVDLQVMGHTAGIVALHCYSYNTNMWDAGVEASFPRTVESMAVTTANISNVERAELVLDANFFLGDEAQQIGFLGITMTNNATAPATNLGGVYRIDYTSVGAANVLYQIYTGATNSVAWDGNNLMEADRAPAMGTRTVRRSANALSPLPTFSPNSIYKTPGTGNMTQVIFNATSGLGLAVSRGNGSAIAKTTDYGKTFNGYQLVDSHFGNMNDYWVKSDASVIYALTTDNVDLNLWKGNFTGFGYSWERVFMNAGQAVAGDNPALDPHWMVRADDDDADNVYLALSGAKNMFKSTDGAVNWTPRSCSQNIQDYAVQDANTVYVAVIGSNGIVKTESGGLSWSDPPIGVLAVAGGAVYQIRLLSDDNLLLSGANGGIGYTTDGSTWSYIAGPMFGGFYSVVDATGLNAGDTIFQGNPIEIASWTIGASFIWNEQFTTVSGLEYANGVLYTIDASGGAASNNMSRWLYPTDPVFGAGIAAVPTDVVAVAGPAAAGFPVMNQFQAGFGGQTLINPIQVTIGTSMFSGATTVTLWAREADATKAGVDTLDNYTEFLTSAADAPTCVYPTSDTIVPINSISGAVSTFNYVWNAPPSIADTGVRTVYDYDWIVYLDQAGTNVVGTVGTVLPAASVAPQLSVVDPMAGAYAQGTTYYWRIRVSAGVPLQSYYSAMETFTIQQLVAVVPVISSPENGAEVNTTTPGFSWSPIENTTGYRFELATDADFTDIVYTVDSTTAGAQLPADITLTRGMQYFWHVKALTPLEGEWSTTANFIVAELPPETTPVTITTAPQPTITAVIEQPQATTTTIVVPPAEEKVVNPSYIWAIIVVGAVLVIAVIILIVRTRRTV
jgi:hypothetical protein